jgi:uncharacterized protein (TIGR03435 family)
MKRAVLFLSPVVMVVTGLALVASRPVALRAQGQASDRRPRFEVASVKQNLSNDRRSFAAQPGGRLVVTNFALKDLIAAAFGMADMQALVAERIIGPAWIETERYNIDAKASAEFQFAPGGPPQEAILMLRSLLEDRFKLVARREKRELPIFELVVARKDGTLGPGLHKSKIDCDALFAGGRATVPPAPPSGPNEPPPCRMIGGPARTIAAGVTMQQLAANLTNHLQRFVVDKTGLTERFDFNLGWTPEKLPTGTPPPGIPPVDPNGPPLVTALQEQLGLKVEAAKGPVDVLVIDSVEHPTPD